VPHGSTTVGIDLGLKRLSQKGTQPNATAFLALTIQALIKLNCSGLYLLRQPLKSMATFSEGTVFAPQKWYRESEQAPGIAQRAKKKRRVKAIHARIANQRKDAIHKETTALVKKHAAIFVGDVNAKALAKTGMAKSVHDAAWTTFRTQLRYKAIRQCVVFAEVNEAISTQTVRAAGPFPPAVRKVGQGLE
jgi:putative transposase